VVLGPKRRFQIGIHAGKWTFHCSPSSFVLRDNDRMLKLARELGFQDGQAVGAKVTLAL
jgi:hypothetical protein